MKLGPAVRILCFLIFIYPCDLAYPAIEYYLEVTNNVELSDSTVRADYECPIGYIGEDNSDWGGSYATQDIIATPPEGFVFSYWSGDVPAELITSRSITVRMDQDRKVMGHFLPVSYKKVITRGYIHSSPLLYDINHDGFQEIIVGDTAGFVYCFGYDGDLIWKYYAGNAFDRGVSPIPKWFNGEFDSNTEVGNITIQSSPAAGDIDGDMIPEIIVGVGGLVDNNLPGGVSTGFGPVGQGGILILNADGTLKLLIRGWDTFDGLGNPLQDGFSDGFYSTPALGDIDKDGRLDFVIGGTDQNIYAMKISFSDTSLGSLGQRIRYYHPPGKDGIWAVPLFEIDDDGDGKFNEDPVGEMTPITYYDISGEVPGYIGEDDDGDGLVDEGVVNGNGPVGDDDEDSCQQLGYVDWDFVDEDEFEWPFRNADTIISSPALGDFTGDGFMDVVIGCDTSGAAPLKSNRKDLSSYGSGGILRVLDRQANELGFFPQWIDQVVWSSPALADIDGDGMPEVFVGTGPVVQYSTNGVYAFRADGSSYLSGAMPEGFFAATHDIVFSSPAIGDIDGDGSPEIVVGDFSGYVYAWDLSGALLSGFPVLPLDAGGHPGMDNCQIRSSPILVDVDGDNKPEIVIGVGWAIIAINGDGSIVPEFMFGHTSFTTGSTSVFSSPAAGDIDNDGVLDLVWAGGESNDGGLTVTNGVVHIWSWAPYNVNSNPWPMFKRTATRISSYSLHLENPIFDPDPSRIGKGESFKASVRVYPGREPVSNVLLCMAIDGTSACFQLHDNGLDGDVQQGDNIYAGTVNLPVELENIGDLRITAEGTGLESCEMMIAASFSYIAILNTVSKYYYDILDRPPDPAGFSHWTNEIERIRNLGVDPKEGFVALARVFFNSEEYINKKKTNEQFVTDLYQVFLSRDPDAGELAYWAGLLSSDDPDLPALTRDMLITAFRSSEEFKLYMDSKLGSGARRPENYLLNDLYRGFLSRLPDTSGFEGWLVSLRNAQCSGPESIRTLVHDIAEAFLNSAEYVQRQRDNSEFVEDLYNGILRRAPDQPGFFVWLQLLENGSYSRAQLLSKFIACQEFQLRANEVVAAGCIF